ncbi:P-loop containing nucleoside triphosphate hydrolase protein [Morchella conica CCBAS932]|uniref:P-loop containing nucleoside triphosphate hydrolase protein n=1 Tax=Morchella conica CCBAS932 TaxID=1392247 RepID=A0A3N4KP39_9PEZI|nr:P-loop containing nucleoside triphosphate hydrolase protein [Morchella conica CCBAS932]
MPPHSSILISISGGSSAGKKTVLTGLESALRTASNNTLSITTLHQRDFLHPLTEAQHASAADGKLDLEKLGILPFPLPLPPPGGVGVYDLDFMAETISALLAGAGNVKVPVVDAQHRRGGERTVVEAPDVVIAEGCYLLTHRRLVELAGVKIFVDCDADVRLARKVVRDQETSKLPLDVILDQYVRHCKPAYEQTILPTKTVSDIILPAGAEGPGIELIAHGVMDDLKGRRRRPSLTLTSYSLKYNYYY